MYYNNCIYRILMKMKPKARARYLSKPSKILIETTKQDLNGDIFNQDIEADSYAEEDANDNIYKETNHLAILI